MDDFKRVVAQNISSLRTANGMTQAELGEKLNYSDKSISKWERADAVPDAYILKQMATIFDVTVDFILTEHENMPPLPEKKEHRYSRKAIMALSFFAIWACAMIAFVICWLSANLILWQLFIACIPVSLLTVMIENTIWGKRIGNFVLVSCFEWSTLLAIFLCFIDKMWWQILLIGPIAQIVTIVAFNVKIIKNR